MSYTVIDVDIIANGESYFLCLLRKSHLGSGSRLPELRTFAAGRTAKTGKRENGAFGRLILFPLLGIFFWYWLESSRPQTSAACGKYAFLSLLILIELIAVSFLISLILGIVRGGV